MSIRSAVQSILVSCAKSVLAQKKPTVVGITGSVGKSSTKLAVAAVLAQRFSVRASAKNYNTEFGVPLAVLDLMLPASRWGWGSVVLKAIGRTISGAEYPAMLVLEMGADHPGDIAYLTSVAQPNIGIVTAVGESHAEMLGSIDAIAKEKSQLLRGIDKRGWAILNRDDARVWAMGQKTKARVLGFGFDPAADVRGSDLTIRCDADHPEACGVEFAISSKNETTHVFMRGMYGMQAAYAGLAAAAAGIALGMTLDEISDGLAKFSGAPGRMRALSGVKRTVLIDDTYNAAPRSMLAALDTLAELPLANNAKRVAILGDMLELGKMSVKYHQDIGAAAAKKGFDALVFVGEKMGDAEKSALAAGAPREKTFHFSKGQEAAKFVQERIAPGDAVLVKGSRGMLLELAVKELMAEPEKASEQLVSGYTTFE